ncbi:MAG: Plastidic atp adp transporter [candidate division TM6 bacterium GW2011_GWF2_36_131]|nr:MAG: Plastidic atp adp transporter [candidate division TM6 bacterium GW2011_GWF2_36_131]KKQ19573.1 MAG: Plastidic atp adp transporter [candidate division TM6 bacterium GW2011_GWA2_36_9]
MLHSFKKLWTLNRDERSKLFWMIAVFALVIAAYTICKEMKDLIFVEIVGEDYVPKAKLVSLVVLIPAILFYSFLVNRLRRYQLLCFYAILYGILGLIFTYLLGHPTIGIPNTDQSPWRLFGWIFYIFIEGYSPFIVSVMWAFTNSIFSPKEAKDSYGLLVAGTKIGGILSAAFGWFLLKPIIPWSGLVKQQLLVLLPSLIILLVPIGIMLFIKNVSGHLLHGYEAAYDYQKEMAKKQERPGLFAGIKVLIQEPYVLGIFSIIFFYEVLNAVLSFLRIIYAKGAAVGVEDFGSKLFAMALGYHFIGFLIALFGTNALLRWLGERRCLILIPVVLGMLLFGFLAIGTYGALAFVFVAFRAINYGFFYPVRESLYIPTIKAVKFQSKAWIDAFGTKFAKATGSQFNILANLVRAGFGQGLFQLFHWVFFVVVLGCWTVVAVLLGKRYVTAIENNEVIGAEPLKD